VTTEAFEKWTAEFQEEMRRKKEAEGGVEKPKVWAGGILALSYLARFGAKQVIR
jgi:hypothetical protein